MPAMILRDWALAASDLIDYRLGGQPVYPHQPEAIWESLAITKERDFTYPASTGQDRTAAACIHSGDVPSDRLTCSTLQSTDLQSAFVYH